MEDQLYKKVGRKYQKIGYFDNFNGFPSEGIWIVYNNPGVLSSSCIARVGEFKDLNYELLANLTRTKEDKISKILGDALHRSNFTRAELVKEILEEICRND